MALNRRAYVGVLVTLTSNGSIYNLKTLVDAILTAESQNTTGATVESSGAAREMYLQAPAGNSGSVYVGDANLVAGGSGRASGELVKGGAPRHYGTGDTKSVDFSQIYATPATNGDKLYVELLVG
jgi:hypothetical protein